MRIIGERNRPSDLSNSRSEVYGVLHAVPRGKRMRFCGHKKPGTGYGGESCHTKNLDLCSESPLTLKLLTKRVTCSFFSAYHKSVRSCITNEKKIFRRQCLGDL